MDSSTQTEQTNTYQVINKGYCNFQLQTQGEVQGKLHAYRYPMPAVTVDLIVFDSSHNKVLLVKRSQNTEPAEFRGCWAIPGGFLNSNETALSGAQREFKEETGEDAPTKLWFVTAATDPNRDPRQRTVSLVYAAVTSKTPTEFHPEDVEEISGVQWINVDQIISGQIKVAFDHYSLISLAKESIQ